MYIGTQTLGSKEIERQIEEILKNLTQDYDKGQVVVIGDSRSFWELHITTPCGRKVHHTLYPSIEEHAPENVVALVKMELVSGAKA